MKDSTKRQVLRAAADQDAASAALEKYKKIGNPADLREVNKLIDKNSAQSTKEKLKNNS